MSTIQVNGLSGLVRTLEQARMRDPRAYLLNGSTTPGSDRTKYLTFDFPTSTGTQAFSLAADTRTRAIEEFLKLARGAQRLEDVLTPARTSGGRTKLVLRSSAGSAGWYCYAT